jgi:hypothetical protein
MHILTLDAGASMPLLVALWLHRRSTQQAGLLADHKPPLQRRKLRQLAISTLGHLDVVDNLLLLIMFATTLVPLTTTGTNLDHWQDASLSFSLVMGTFSISVWLRGEQKHARSLLLPHKVRCFPVLTKLSLIKL